MTGPYKILTFGFLLLFTSGCISQRAEYKTSAAIFETQQPYRQDACYGYKVKHGQGVVLSLSRNWGVPLPHMINGYTVYIEIPDAMTIKDSTFKIPSYNARAYLHLVPDKCTNSVVGNLSIISNESGAIWANLSLQAKDAISGIYRDKDFIIDWNYNGAVQFTLSESLE